VNPELEGNSALIRRNHALPIWQEAGIQMLAGDQISEVKFSDSLGSFVSSPGSAMV